CVIAAATAGDDAFDFW
nr:immunoglobulin heavy chain junction region [Macaca mulatta]